MNNQPSEIIGRPFREAHPRLYHPVDDPDYEFALPRDAIRQRILENLLADCEAFSSQNPWPRIPERLDSPHPYHQLYITFYTGMHSTALLETYAFAARLTGSDPWLRKARQWMLAHSRWEHSDRVQEHFYTANRYMHALALSLDLLAGKLPTREEDAATECLVHMMRRWWPEVDKNRHSKEGGHHAVVDNGHFGVAALHLLGKHGEAVEWVQAVLDRFRAAIMPDGCGRQGEPVDGPSFWPWENLWMLQFADALRNVAGVDLYREFPERLERPLQWFRSLLAAPGYHLSAGRRAAWSTTLLRLAQETGDAELRETALGDPLLGRIYRFQMGVKNSSAECLLAYGPSAYLYVEPSFRARRQRPVSKKARRFEDARNGQCVVLRCGTEDGSLVAALTGYGGGVAHGFSDLQLFGAGRPVLKTISCRETQPVPCGSLACVGGQNELVTFLRKPMSAPDCDRVQARSTRLDQEFWLLHGPPPIFLAAFRRKARGTNVQEQGASAFVRTDGDDCLQFPRNLYFNPNAGRIRMTLRLIERVDPSRPQVLFNTGIGVPGLMGSQVNIFTLGFFGGPGLAFGLQDQQGREIEARILPDRLAFKPGKWHKITAAWEGLNDPLGRPSLELEVDGCRARWPAAPRPRDSRPGNESSKTADIQGPIYIDPKTLLSFGGALQMPGTGMKSDFRRIELESPKRRPLVFGPENGFKGESGSGPLEWKFNPVELRNIQPFRAMLGVGPRVLEAVPLFPATARLEEEVVPYAPAGLAASSLKNLMPDAGRPAKRVLALAGLENFLMVAFALRTARLQVVRNERGFVLRTAGEDKEFEVRARGMPLLHLCPNRG